MGCGFLKDLLEEQHPQFLLTGDENASLYLALWRLVQQELSKLNLEDQNHILAKALNYPNLKPMLESYLTGKKVERWDDLLRVGDELRFEKEILFRILLDLLSRILGNQAQIILEHFQFSGPLMGDFVLYLLSLPQRSGPGFLLVYGQGQLVSTHWSNDQRRKLSDLLQRTSLIHFPLLRVPHEDTNSQSPLFHRGSLEDLALHRMLGDYQRGIDIADFMKREHQRSWVYLWRTGLLQLQAGEFSKAQVNLGEAYDLAKINAPEETWKVSLTLALCLQRKESFSMARTAFHRVEQSVGEDLSQEERCFLITARIIIREYHWEDEEQAREYFKQVLELEKSEDSRYVLITKTMLSYYQALGAVGGKEFAKKKSFATLEELKSDGNLFQLSKLYHMLAYLHQEEQPDQARDFFLKDIRLRKKIATAVGLIKAYNGYGYFQLCQGKNSGALKYFKLALELLEDTEDFTEAGLTMINTATVLFIQRRFDLSLNVLEILVEILQGLGLPGLPYHPLEEVLALAGVAAFRHGNVLLSMDYYQRMIDQEKDTGNSAVALLLESFHHRMEGRKEKSVTSLEKAFGRAKNTYQEGLSQHITLEWVLFLQENQEDSKAKELIAKYFDRDSDLFEHYSDVLETGIFTSKSSLGQGISEILLICRSILAKARQAASHFNLYRRLGEISFLGNLQKRLLEQGSDYPVLFIKILDILFDYNPARGYLLAWNISGQNLVQQKGLEKGCSSELLDLVMAVGSPLLWRDGLPVHGAPLCQEIGKSCDSFVVVPFQGSRAGRGSLLVTSRPGNAPLDREDLRIFELAVQQIMVALTNLELLEQLRSHNREIQAKNQSLEDLIKELTTTQKKLVEVYKMASLGSLVAGVAHEINTPLGIAITASTYLDEIRLRMENVLANKSPKDQVLLPFLEEWHEGMDILVSNLRRSADLVKNFKQIAVDNNTEERRIIDLGQYVLEILDSLQPMIREHEAQVSLKSWGDLSLNTFPSAIYKIINNLVGNSLIHGKKDGIELTIKLRARIHQGWVYFSHQDNGKGMDHATQEKVFEPFFTTRRNRGGVGLGMSITYNQITQVLGGSVEIRSKPGQGTRFFIRFPVGPHR